MQQAIQNFVVFVLDIPSKRSLLNVDPTKFVKTQNVCFPNQYKKASILNGIPISLLAFSLFNSLSPISEQSILHFLQSQTGFYSLQDKRV